MDEVANVRGYDGLVTHSAGLYRGPYGILASRATGTPGRKRHG